MKQEISIQKENKKNILELIQNINQKYEFSFDELNHKYYIEKNIELISATTFLSKFFYFDEKKIARKIAEKYFTTEDEILETWRKKAEFGDEIHFLIEKYINSKNNKDNKNNNYNVNNLEINFKYIKKFVDELFVNYNIIASEIPIFSKKYKIAGTVDLLIQDKKTNRLYTLDWKTTNKKISKKDIFNFCKNPITQIPNNKFYKYSMQLGLYNKILFDNYGVEIFDSIVVHINYDFETCEIIEPVNLDYEISELLDLKIKNL